jgi:hypothetical protein
VCVCECVLWHCATRITSLTVLTAFQQMPPTSPRCQTFLDQFFLSQQLILGCRKIEIWLRVHIQDVDAVRANAMLRYVNRLICQRLLREVGPTQCSGTLKERERERTRETSPVAVCASVCVLCNVGYMHCAVGVTVTYCVPYSALTPQVLARGAPPGVL